MSSKRTPIKSGRSPREFMPFEIILSLRLSFQRRVGLRLGAVSAAARVECLLVRSSWTAVSARVLDGESLPNPALNTDAVRPQRAG